MANFWGVITDAITPLAGPNEGTGIFREQTGRSTTVDLDTVGDKTIDLDNIGDIDAVEVPKLRPSLQVSSKDGLDDPALYEVLEDDVPEDVPLVHDQLRSKLVPPQSSKAASSVVSHVVGDSADLPVILGRQKPLVQLALDSSDPLPGDTPQSREAGTFSPAMKAPSKGTMPSAITTITSIPDSDFDDEKPRCCRCNPLRCSVAGFCHCLYTLFFFCFLICFPLFLKWMISAPKPPQHWYEEYKKFPLLSDWRFVQNNRGSAYKLSLSEIPQTWGACNHTCSQWNGALRATSEMNFKVQMKLEAPQFKHTAYPVLLASNNFNDWWVAADRRHAAPQQYFASHTASAGNIFRHVTEKCNRPPQIVPDQPASVDERFTEVPTYVLTCVVWTSQKANWHRQNTSMTASDLSKYCDAIGGVCGWPCGSGAKNSDLPGCSDGILHVDKFNGSSRVAGYPLPTAHLSGHVSMRACRRRPGSDECTTSAEPMSQWPCHRCRNVSFISTTAEITSTTGWISTTTKQLQEENTFYDSLPPLEVVLKDAVMDKSLQDTVSPQAFVLTSPLAADGQGPAGMTTGAWKKLYDPVYYPKPLPVDEQPTPPEDLEWYEEFTTPLPSVETNRHEMQFESNNKVTIEPEWCYGRRGPLYLVACAVNSSSHEDGFAFTAGQKVAPPPFNDRCLAVTGRCAFACMERQEPMLHCDAGEIPREKLVGNTETKDNRVAAVYMFIWTLVFGFAVKVLSYLPGIFVPYPKAKYYSPQMTEHLKYIAVCAPSAHETKACVVRNLVGAMSSLPESCRCPFHVVFADEGHRHPHKIMFRAFVSVLQYVPDVLMTKYNPAKPKYGKKAENLRRFTREWVESTKKMKLADCSTEELVKKIRILSPDSDQARKLEEKIDALSGFAALKALQEKHGWPSARSAPEVQELEASILQLRMELVVGESRFANAPIPRDLPKSLQEDDCEAYGWQDPRDTADYPTPLYHLHYVARAAPEEDERTMKVQHVARGIWCYKVPKREDKREKYNWLDFRKKAHVFEIGDDVNQPGNFLVPLCTSRGKAGGLNFAENYLFDFTCRQQKKRDRNMHSEATLSQCKHSLFSVAEARHQYQPDFFVETVPYFFTGTEELNPRVAFTTCPPYFHESPDDADFLDTNNANFFRLGCMLRNCCGGVSSRGTNATWLVRDRPIHSSSSLWELEAEREMDLGFTQVVERRFFHENCKLEDEASSLDRMVKGKYSQYINTRLSYGMAKEPTDHLVGIQRWVEGGVVLSLETFFGRQQGVYMIWISFLLFCLFVASLLFMVYGTTSNFGWFVSPVLQLLAGDTLEDSIKETCKTMAQFSCNALSLEESALEDYQQMFYDVIMWLIGVLITTVIIWCLTTLSYLLHICTWSCGSDSYRRTRFPITIAQWARLMVAVDNLIYFLWFWTAFFWVGFNYYSAFATRNYFFNPQAMAFFTWALLILNWSMILCATTRDSSKATRMRNEVSGLGLTNIWRSTQLFYITAPLTAYAILTGLSDFMRYRMFNEDITVRQDAQRGKISKLIVKIWTLLLVLGMCLSWVSFWIGWLPDSSNAVASVIVITFIGFDVVHPCTFLWLGTVPERLPKKEEVTEEKQAASGVSGQLLRFCSWILSLFTSVAFYRNFIRSFVFSPKTTGIIKMLGPLQHVSLPFLAIFIPHLGVQQVLMLLAAVK